MKKLTIAGRLLLGLPILFYGAMHLVQGSKMVHFIAHMPAAHFLVVASGIGLVLGALGVILNRFTIASCLGLVAILLCFNLFLHWRALGLAAGAVFDAWLAGQKTQPTVDPQLRELVGQTLQGHEFVFSMANLMVIGGLLLYAGLTARLRALGLR